VPIAIDAVEQGFVIEGGDAMVVDAKTMFLGVGNRTTPEAGAILARQLDMDIYTVQIGTPAYLREVQPGEQPDFSPLALLFLHLDTSFTLVGPKHALALPYIFEAAHSEDNPLARYIRGAMRQSMLKEEDGTKGLELLKGIGTLTRYAAGTGKVEKIDKMKLVDFCRSQGYKITNTGGAIPKGDDAAFSHFMSVTYPEQRRQASNVVQAVPGRVIAYDGNPATQAALEADGIAVDTFPGRELWNWHGGPHCLTQPLLRS
jgi:arginine deiminase